MEQMKIWYDQVKKYEKHMNITIGIAGLSLFLALGTQGAIDNNSIPLVQYYVQMSICGLMVGASMWYYKLLEIKARRTKRRMRTYMKRKTNAA